MRILKFVIASLVVSGGAVGAERLTARTFLPALVPSAVAVEAQSPASDPATAPPEAQPEPGAEAPPAPEVGSAAVAGLQAELTEIARRANVGAQVGVLVVSLERGDTLFSLNPDVPLAPASNMKLYSTAAALYYLGPEFRYSTYVLGLGEVENGVLHGDLILYGTGDPALTGRMLGASIVPMRALADTLLARGIREVRGDVIGDGSYFDAEWLGRGWNPDNFGTWYSAPVGALNFGENLTSLEVRPGAVGAPAQITTTPATHGLAVVNRTITNAGGGTMIRIQYEPEGLTVRGQMARGSSGIARAAPVVDPTNYAAAVFHQVLAGRGIQVHGGVRSIYAAEESPVTFANRQNRNGNAQPHPRVLAIHLSPTLAELASVTNHISHNLFAEALMKTVGRVALGEGTFDAGSRAIRYFLECEAGVDTTALAIMDGSGLSPLNRVTARATVQLLDAMTRNEHWEDFFTSLPEAGRPRPRGLNRMLGTPAVGNLRAKTGTIRTVSALSGYVRSADGELLAFSILGNNLPASTWLQKRIEDQIGIRLAHFERTAGSPALAGRSGRAAPAARSQQPAAQQPQQRPAATTGGRDYRIRPGDTLDRIARQNRTTVRAIEQANPGINPNRIRAGQTIRLPE
jgi:serine-type D-Ala-D-Ala carboxypeptidase/endopeptidase (penicillin-binding protein 4)